MDLAQEPDNYDAGMRKHHFEVRAYLYLTRHSLYRMGLRFVVLCIDAGSRDGLHLRQGLRYKAIHLNGRTKITGKTAIDTEENKRVRRRTHRRHDFQPGNMINLRQTIDTMFD